jgi:hypothetical protein
MCDGNKCEDKRKFAHTRQKQKKKTEIVETSRSRFFFFDETFPAN